MKKVVTRSINIRGLAVQSRELFIEIVDSAQDDSSVIMLMQFRASRARSSTSRSYNQPPLMRHREVAYYAKQESRRRSLLEKYHLSFFDSRRQISCASDKNVNRFFGLPLRKSNKWKIYYIRNCVKGTSSG